VATHACAHAVCRSTRNLTDRQLDAIRESGGIVGFNFSVCDVRPDANLDENTPIDTVVHHLRYLLDRMGEDHVALGSDFDGAVMPRPLRDASCFPNLVRSLRAKGFSDETVGKIAFGNWMRVFRLTWR
jgi:membrane dipeptidase